MTLNCRIIGSFLFIGILLVACKEKEDKNIKVDKLPDASVDAAATDTPSIQSEKVSITVASYNIRHFQGKQNSAPKPKESETQTDTLVGTDSDQNSEPTFVDGGEMDASTETRRDGGLDGGDSRDTQNATDVASDTDNLEPESFTPWADVEWCPDPTKEGFYDFFEKALREVDAEVIALQELPSTQSFENAPYNPAYKDILPELARRLGMYFYVQDYAEFHGFGFLSKYEIVEAVNFALDAPNDGIIRVTLKVGDKKLAVYNTHQYYLNSEERQRDAEYNLNIIKTEAIFPHIILGDFNVPVSHIQVSHQPDEMALYLNDGYLWEGSYKDYILYRDDVSVTAFTAVDTPFLNEKHPDSYGELCASDHLPVRAIVTF